MTTAIADDDNERPEFCTDEMLEFLDELRESGVTNMFGAAPCLRDSFDFDRPNKDARAVLTYWMHTFGQEELQGSLFEPKSPREGLQALEWSGYVQGQGSGFMSSGNDGRLYPACPVCHGLKEEAVGDLNKSAVGHRPACWLMRLLKER